MPKPLEINLSGEARRELERVRDQEPRAYLRERAAAILKVADGQSGRQVAQQGLLKPRWPEAVYRWIKAYQAGGTAGLLIKTGRGRKPAFSPSVHE